jgi:hypothetical protein
MWKSGIPKKYGKVSDKPILYFGSPLVAFVDAIFLVPAVPRSYWFFTGRIFPLG